MKNEFEISLVGELIFFLNFQIKQRKEGIHVHQTKWEMPKK